MKKLIATIILSLMLTPAVYANHQYDYDNDYNYGHYYNYPQPNSQFQPQHPDYYNGNKRLELKERADIERASATNWHFDQHARDYYRCNWVYNQNLGTWVCEKEYSSKPKSVAVCPVGYQLSAQKTYCLKTGYTPPVKQASAEPEPVEITRYVYVYEETEPVIPPELPSTGSGLIGIMLASVCGVFLSHTRNRNKQPGKVRQKARK